MKYNISYRKLIMGEDGEKNNVTKVSDMPVFYEYFGVWIGDP